MVRSARQVDRNRLKKGLWTPVEDRKLIAYVTRNGCGIWSQLPKGAGLSRSAKSCRLRWINYLRPNMEGGNYSLAEAETIVNLPEILGNSWSAIAAPQMAFHWHEYKSEETWSAIAAHLPGRTDADIENYWKTKLINQNPTYEKKNHSETHLIKDLTNQNQSPSAEGWSGWLADCSDYCLSSSHAPSSSSSSINWFNVDSVDSSETSDDFHGD